MYYDPISDRDIYHVLTLSLTDSVFKSFYCSCCRACDSKSSACIFPIPKPIVLDQEWIVLSYHLSTNSFLSYEAFSNLLTIGKERMMSLYPKGVTLFHEGSLQPYSHPNAYLSSDVSFPFTPCPYTEIHKLYKLYSILASYASMTNHAVVWQCRWMSSVPRVQFRFVDLDKASKDHSPLIASERSSTSPQAGSAFKERAFYSLNLEIHDRIKDSGKQLDGLVPIPDEVYSSEIVFPDSLDITHWNKLQSQTHQRGLVDRLRSLREMTQYNIYLLGLYSVKLLQGGYSPKQIQQEIEALKWPLLIRSRGQKKKGPSALH
jgi:hypothetical protein